jgi:hypothetical protein
VDKPDRHRNESTGFGALVPRADFIWLVSLPCRRAQAADADAAEDNAMPTRRKVLTTFACIGFAGFAIAGVARFADGALHLYHVAWPWLDHLRWCGLGFGTIALWGVLFASPDKPQQTRWRSWLLLSAREIISRETISIVVFFGAVTALIFWTRDATSAPSVLIRILAKDSDLWWLLVLWLFWREANRRQDIIEGIQSERNQASLGAC